MSREAYFQNLLSVLCLFRHVYQTCLLQVVCVVETLLVFRSLMSIVGNLRL